MEIIDSLSAAEAFLHQENKLDLIPSIILPLEHKVIKSFEGVVKSLTTNCLCKIK